MFWDRFFEARPRLALCLCAMIFIVAASGLPKLAISGDSKAFFADDNINLVQFKALEAEYALTQGIGLALHAEDGDLFTEERLSVIRQLTEEAWKLPYTRRVSSITNAPRMSSDGDELVIEDMMEDASMDPRLLRTRVMEDELLVDRLISPDGKTTIIVIIAEGIGEVSDRADTVSTALRDLVAQSDAQAAGLVPWYGGRLAIIDALSKAGKRDLATLLPTTVLVIGILTFLLLRSALFAVVLVITPLLSAVATLGFASHFGIEIMALTANIPSVVLMLGVAGFSHLVMAIQDEQLAGHEPSEAVSRAIGSNAAPIALTFVTTALGFLMLNFADAPPVNVLGSLVALGGVICLVLGFLGIPALVRLLEPQASVPRPFLSRAANAASSLVTADSSRASLGVGALALLIASGSLLLKPDDFIPHFFNGSYEFRQHLDRLEDELPAFGVVEFDLSHAGSDAITDPSFVRELEDFERYLGDLPNVTHVYSIAETFRRLHTHLNADDLAAADGLPQDGDALAQYLLLYEMSLPFGQDLTDRVSMDKSGTRVSAVVREASNANLNIIKHQADAWLESAASPLIAGHATGLSPMYAQLTLINVRSMIGGTAAALVLISIILILAFRSLAYGIVSLLPNLLPGAVAFGIWGYVVGDVGIASSIVGAVTLGIIVDDTIHMIWRYQEGRRLGMPPKQATRAMFDHAGRPILVSSIVLTLGYLVMASSGFYITATLGQLSALIILSALIFDWFLLAPLLIVLDPLLEPNRQVRRQSAAPASSYSSAAAGSAGPAPKDAHEQARETG
ncbi:MAG: MMPL family transporter [Pseudomonadota bacterium]